jgi:hypothetical protein
MRPIEPLFLGDFISLRKLEKEVLEESTWLHSGSFSDWQKRLESLVCQFDDSTENGEYNLAVETLRKDFLAWLKAAYSRSDKLRKILAPRIQVVPGRSMAEKMLKCRELMNPASNLHNIHVFREPDAPWNSAIILPAFEHPTLAGEERGMSKDAYVQHPNDIDSLSLKNLIGLILNGEAKRTTQADELPAMGDLIK